MENGRIAISRTSHLGFAAGLVVAVVAASVGCNGKSSSSSSSSGTASGSTVVLSPGDGSTLPDAVVGDSYSETFSVVSGGTAPYSILAGGTPTGLAFVSSGSAGTLSGTPTQQGSGIFQVEATDATGNITVASYELTVDGVGGTLSIGPTSAPGGTANAPYSFALSVVGGTAPYDFTISNGSPPPGITLGPSASGVDGQATLSGTPVAQGTGTYTFTVNVTDSSSPTKKGSQVYSITIQ